MALNHKALLYRVFVFSLFCASLTVYGERYKRPMVIHHVKKMGLEIWTEMQPKWNTELMMNGKKPIFVAHTPVNVYPPSGMTWVNHEEVKINSQDFPDIARSTLLTAAANYGVSGDMTSRLEITPATYGYLQGYEANFVGKINNREVDVKVFSGRTKNKGPVTMQVYAPIGKLEHLNEQIRRSWTHTRYLTE